MRLVLFSIVALCVLFSPFPVAVLCAFLYAFWYSGFEIIFLGACIDAQFSVTAIDTFYWYTVSFALVIIVTNFIRPYINIRGSES